MSAASTGGSRLRVLGDHVLAGMLALLPLLASWFALKFALGVARDGSLWLLDLLLTVPFLRGALMAAGVPLRPDLAGVAALPWGLEVAVSVLAVTLTVVFLAGVGWLSRRVLGRRLLGLGHAALGALPGLGVVYRSVVRLVNALEGNAGPAFDEPVRVPFLHDGVESLGFVTRRGETHCAVFVPTAPNPTSGFLLIVPTPALRPVVLDTGEALTAVLSAGVLLDVDRVVGDPPGP